MDRNLYLSSFVLASLVALRKESVDRNPGTSTTLFITVVALRKESVDRNQTFPPIWTLTTRRSPQGERG